MALTKSQQWFTDNVSENVKELLEIGDLANREIDDKISIGIGDPRTTFAIYSNIFNCICEEIRKYEEEGWTDFDLNIADRLHIGYTTTQCDDDEKAGNFMVYLQDPGITVSDDTVGDEANTDTIELCTSWNAANVHAQSDILKAISASAKNSLSSIMNLKTESNEFILPLFCIIHSSILKYIRLKRVELKQDEYELNIAGLYTVGIREIASDTDVEEETYYVPSISLKLFFKDDANATGRY